MATSIEVVLENLKTHPSAEVHEPVTRDELRRVLRIIRVKLPKSFVEYLTKIGWVEISGETVFGLGPGIDDASSWEERTSQAWVVDLPTMPSRYTPVMEDGMGGYYCLDTENATKEDCAVVHWNHEDPDGDEQIPEIVSSTFADWLQQLLDEAPNV